MIHDPPVSVILPVYKGEKFVRDAISSILEQSFAEFELVVINDASPDDSEQVILGLADSRIRYHRLERNLGLIGALNRGIDLATGRYLARMDQDDVAHRDRLNDQYEFLESHPRHVVVGTQTRIIGTEIIKRWPLEDAQMKAHLLFGSPICHPTAMIRRSTLDENSLRYEEAFKHAEDYGLWMRLASRGEMANLDTVGLHYRTHPGQYTTVYSDGMKNAARSIRVAYLQSLGVHLENADLGIYHEVASRQVRLESAEELRKVGGFLARFRRLLWDSSIDRKELTTLLYTIWTRLCVDRKKLGHRSYSVFLSSPVALWKFDVKLHLWLLKPGR